jgi:hypothetical protein
MKKQEVIKGQKFSRLSIICEVEKHIMPSGQTQRKFKCECECGNIIIVHLSSLNRGNTKSCGCYMKERVSITNKKHGHSVGKVSRTYVSWLALKDRCTNPNNNRYDIYGGRGIKFCERWLKFENFLEDMGERPIKTSIDRINSNGNYEPTNCKWSSSVEQNKNRRKFKRNVHN